MFIAPLLSALALVTSGVTCSRIQLHRNASHVEVRAARELRDAIRRMVYTDMNYTITPGGEYADGRFGGAEIVLVTEAEGPNLLPRRARERLAATTNREAFVIATREDRGCGPCGLHRWQDADCRLLWRLRVPGGLSWLRFLPCWTGWDGHPEAKDDQGSGRDIRLPRAMDQVSSHVVLEQGRRADSDP